MIPTARPGRRPGSVDPAASAELRVNADPLPPGGVQLFRERSSGRINAAQVTASTPFHVLSGSPGWAHTLLVGLGSASPRGSTATFRAYGKQVGYDRRWTAAVGQIAAIDCTGQTGFTIDIEWTNKDGVWPVVVAYNGQVDDRWWREVSWYEAITAPGTRPIPSGATKVLVRAAVPTWSWIARDPVGTEVPFPSPLAPANEYELPTDEFDPGAAAEVIWKIRL